MDRRSFLRLSALLPFSVLSVDRTERKLGDIYVVTTSRPISEQQRAQLIGAMRKLKMHGLIVPDNVKIGKISRVDLKLLHSGIDILLKR